MNQLQPTTWSSQEPAQLLFYPNNSMQANGYVNDAGDFDRVAYQGQLEDACSSRFKKIGQPIKWAKCMKDARAAATEKAKQVHELALAEKQAQSESEFNVVASQLAGGASVASGTDGGSNNTMIIAAVVVLLLLGGGFMFYKSRQAPPPLAPVTK